MVNNGPVRSSLRGFTLLEVLLVVLLIGIVSGLVLLAASPSDPGRIVVGEADRLEESLSLAEDTAVSDNEQFGLLVDEHGYRYLVYDDASRQWLPSDNPAFAPYELPPEVSLRLLVNEKQKAPSLDFRTGSDRPAPDKKALTPQLFILSSGETTALTLSVEAERVTPERITLDDIGNIRRNMTDSSSRNGGPAS